MDELIERLESERDLSRWIIHIDMDAYYAAVEMRDNCALRSVPMAVGGASMLVSVRVLFD
jgi:DNA polymerase kappa